MGRNVALLVLDSVRKDLFDEYAPRLHRLADASFDRCYAASSWSAPSHASILTGELPHRHGIHAHQKSFSRLTREDTFLSELTDHRIVGASANVYAGVPFGFDDLFDEFDSLNKHTVFPRGINVDEFVLESDDGIGRYVEFLRRAYDEGSLLPSILNGAMVKTDELLERFSLPRITDYGGRAIIRSGKRLTRDEPFFFFANFMEAHVPHKPSTTFPRTDVPWRWSSRDVDRWEINNADEGGAYGDYLEQFRRLYGASIRYLDARLGEFVSYLLHETNEETTILVTADHGEELGYPEEGGRIGHVTGLSHALLHVPLLVINPPDTVETFGPFSHLDLGAFIVELVNDRSTAETRRNPPAERIGLSQRIELQNFEFWDRAIRCVYDGNRRFEWDSLGRSTRYEVTGDSTERIVASDIEIPAGMYAQFDGDLLAYKKQAESDDRGTDIDAATRRRLRELGYL